MESQRDTEVQRLLRTQVADILAYFGKDTRHTRNGMFFSPFREENTPSFHVDTSGTLWTDFGEGTGGGVIDLAQRLSGCERSEALSVLSKVAGTVLDRPDVLLPDRVKSSSSAFHIVSTGPLRSPSLLSYASSRGISQSIVSRYCDEVSVRLNGREKAFAYIGFRNNGGGYVLRNSSRLSGKRCTSCKPTFLGSDGTLATDPTCPRVLVFEGFFDFLSYVQSYSPSAGFVHCDVCVLNSIVNISSALAFLQGHERIRLYLDNDNAGRKAAEDLTASLKESGWKGTCEDMSPVYSHYKDFNEMLSASVVSRRRGRGVR